MLLLSIMLLLLGLLCGILEGLHKVGWSDVPIIACETQGAHSFNEAGKENSKKFSHIGFVFCLVFNFVAAVKAGKVVTLPDITSIAKTLGAKTVCKGIYS